MSDDERESCRKALREAFDTASDETLLGLVREIQGDIRIGPDNRVPVMDQWQWDWREALLSAAMDRFDLDGRMPDTPAELVADALASATWRVLQTGWASHRREVPQWLAAWADSLVLDLGELASSAEPVPVVADPLAELVEVEGGYRWYHDGRAPEPVD
ncbi:hypothetical protein H5U98_08895 [Mycolicibacterium boenickei]|uniref:Uncharacterized protein n=1 Tax=Mycolicibacterium boenickei TaxID=146017 RepID=A0AAX3A2A0_9MYCO|nr:hypothetical protein [Mycolicibacterium boenickei]PEG59986.1 hypothetical protein CQY21_15110 [Mycolicibacterium boenickei]UNC01474.1 hypothetical protein H5U98_08895 [Mycolicibacterium boenickei]BBX91365.1 hypothetical protein MBOE_30140 [Mycolicibacterium boenickei]